MSLSFLRRLVLAIVLAGTFYSASADDATKSQTQPAGGERAAAERQEPSKGVLRLLPADAVTEHSIDTSRGKLAYTATAGTLAFYDQSGEQSAAVFYSAYVAKSGAANRPLTFDQWRPGVRDICPPSTLVLSVRVFSISGRTRMTPLARPCATIPTPGSPSPIWS